jgi:kumamolisin
MTNYVTLLGSERTLMPNSRLAGPVDSSKIASVTVRVRSDGNFEALGKKAYELANTPMAKRKYLTHTQLEKLHGASRKDLDKVEHFAHRHNLTVVHRSAAERSVVLRGKLGDLLSAFQADVKLYNHAHGTYRGRQGTIALPEELSGIVTGVFGFDTRRKHRAFYSQKSVAYSGPGGGNAVAATEFAKRYNFPTEYKGTTLDGTGQTIAIIELGGGYRSSDLKVFFQEIGVPVPQISAISVDHAGNDPTTANSADREVMLDIEVAGAVAPKANLAVYFAPNTSKGFLDAISAAIHDAQRKPSVISISWGAPESRHDRQSIQAYHELFVTAAALGITICAASGDHGAIDRNWDGKVHVVHPACDDLVLSCGGTQIDGNGHDVVWNDETGAGGGGISEVFPVPSYQTNAQLPGSLSTGGCGRGVPDIAMSATNYFTRVDTLDTVSGGTSAVAPLMAALVALLNQAKKKNVGFLNPFLYANAANGAVKDVTVGTNAFRGAPGYNAGPGWDACSGLGTPDGMVILDTLP